MAMLDQKYFDINLDSTMWELQAFDAVESTNLIVKNQIRSGQNHGFATCALKQEGGYGRQGRQWVSPYGGLYLSFSLTPSLELAQLSTFALVVSLAAAKTIECFCEKDTLGVKWPNDLLINQAKVIGISLEVVQGTTLCVGIGFNVFKPSTSECVSGKYEPAYLVEQPFFSKFFPKTERVALERGLSLKQKNAVEALAVSFLKNMESYYDSWSIYGFDFFRKEYLSRSCFNGALIEMQAMDSRVVEQGVIVDVDSQGRLVIQKENGALHAVNSGEVHVISLP